MTVSRVTRRAARRRGGAGVRVGVWGLALLALSAAGATRGQVVRFAVVDAVTGATSQKALAEQMRAWIAKKGRLPTEKELKENGADFRRAWNAYRKLKGNVPAKPSGDDYRWASRMRDWVRAHDREPTQSERNKNSDMRRAWNAYQKVLRYERQAKELKDTHRRIEREEAAKRDLQKALAALKQKQYGSALRQLTALKKNANAKALQEDVKAALDEIDAAAKAELEKVTPLVAERKYREAMEAYGKVASAFAGTPTAKAATDARTKLQLDPAVIRELRRQRATALFASANAAYAKGAYLDALTFYEELATKFTDVPEVAGASTKLAAMRADKAIMAGVTAARREREIARLTAEANSFAANGLIDRCVATLRELVAKYPDTPEAAAARLRIKRFGEEP